MFQLYHFMAAGTIATLQRKDGKVDVGITYLKPGDVYDPELGANQARQRCANAEKGGPKNFLKLLPGVEPDALQELVITMRYAEQCGIANSATLRDIVLNGPEKTVKRIQLILDDSARTQERFYAKEEQRILGEIDQRHATIFHLLAARAG